jgi:hypothetical protein
MLGFVKILWWSLAQWSLFERNWPLSAEQSYQHSSLHKADKSKNRQDHPRKLASCFSEFPKHTQYYPLSRAWKHFLLWSSNQSPVPLHKRPLSKRDRRTPALTEAGDIMILQHYGSSVSWLDLKINVKLPIECDSEAINCFFNNWGLWTV